MTNSATATPLAAQILPVIEAQSLDDPLPQEAAVLGMLQQRLKQAAKAG